MRYIEEGLAPQHLRNLALLLQSFEKHQASSSRKPQKWVHRART
jgi:hypothetical protein